MNFKALKRFIVPMLILTGPVVARDDRLVAFHADSADWCGDVNWNQQCALSCPPGGSILNSLCRNGDMGGKNPQNTSTVLCAIGNLDIPGQLSLLTGFVMSLTGAMPINGGPPVDAC